ncbi:DUF1850 domain-containing protein [Ferroglobus placidus]|uniref:DUF1850 domain-containing protein n=1 Tax=Ferroglobus placidus TaxID=54261 RepID=UPI00145DD405|nr:DUF1850 domain-containing protein [Ferroglobus placidus]
MLEVKFDDYALIIPLSSTLLLSVEYVHSVSLTKVIDVYMVNESGIYFVETKWQEFEAGQPLNGSVEGKFFVKKANKYLGKEWKYWFIPLNNFTIKVGKSVFHQPNGEGFLEFRVKTVPAFKLITG